MSSGKSSGHARTDIDTIGADNADASSSNAADPARTADARTSATSAARASSASGSPDRCGACAPPSWWIGAAGTPGSISAIRRRSTTSCAGDAVTATAQPR